MQDDHNKDIDDEFLDDDIEFEDFDDEELESLDDDLDFDDEDLGEIEDLDVDEDTSGLAVEEDDLDSFDDLDDELTAEPLQSRKKSGNSFLTSKAGLAIMSAVILGGGAFAYLKLGGVSGVAPIAPAANNVPANETISAGLPEDMPPMAIPVDADADADTEAESELVELGDELPAADEGVLPSLDMDDTDLAANDAMAEDALPNSFDEPVQQEGGVLTPMPGLSDDDDSLSAPLDSLAALDLPAEEETAVMPEAETIETAEDIEPVSEPQEVEVLEAEVSSEAELVEGEVENETMPLVEEDNSEILAELDEKQKENVALKEEAQQKSEQISEANEEINELEGTVNELNERIALLESQLDNAQRNAQADVSSIKPAIISVEETPKTAPIPPVKKKIQRSESQQSEAQTTKPSPVEKVEWTLRSARPGTAVIADKVNNDLRTIEVGDMVKGLGRVDSIAIEENKWVVRGTKGVIYQ